MVRIFFGLALAAVPPLLELARSFEGGQAWLRPAVWVLFAGLGLVAVLSGVRTVREDLRHERAHARELPERRFSLSPLSVSFLQPFIAATLVALGLVAQVELEEQRADWPPAQELIHLPRKEILGYLALGYRPFVADLVWLRAIAYFGEHLHTDRRYEAMDHYLEAVIHLDPLFKSVYRYAGTITMYNLRRITREAVEASIRYLEQGYRRFPTSWEFPFMICSNYLFEMPRYAADARERLRFQETGAEYCREASVLPGALDYLPSMAGGVLSRIGKRQLAERHFRELILRTDNPRIRKQLEERYAALVSESSARRLQKEAHDFFESHRASFPYLSPDLFLQVGPRGQAEDAMGEIARQLSPEGALP